MEQKIYFGGFYCLIGVIVGFIIGYCVATKKPTVPINIQLQTEHIDSVKASPGVKKLSLNDSTLKEELLKNHIKHPDIVLAQAKLETGNYTSDILKKNNNLFGLRKGNKYYRFKHWSNSVKAYKTLVQSKYNGGDYYKFLAELPYAEDNNYCNKLKDLI